MFTAARMVLQSDIALKIAISHYNNNNNNYYYYYYYDYDY